MIIKIKIIHPSPHTVNLYICVVRKLTYLPLKQSFQAYNTALFINCSHYTISFHLIRISENACYVNQILMIHFLIIEMWFKEIIKRPLFLYISSPSFLLEIQNLQMVFFLGLCGSYSLFHSSSFFSLFSDWIISKFLPLTKGLFLDWLILPWCLIVLSFHSLCSQL